MNTSVTSQTLHIFPNAVRASLFLKSVEKSSPSLRLIRCGPEVLLDRGSADDFDQAHRLLFMFLQGSYCVEMDL